MALPEEMVGGISQTAAPARPARAVSPRVDVSVPQSSIGIVAPFDFALDRELWRLVPDEVTLHVTRTPYVDLEVSIELAHEVADIEAVGRSVRDLAVVKPAVTVYLCTSGSFVEGLSGEAGLRTVMESRGAARAITTSGALLEALRVLGVRRIGVGTPYDLALTARLEAFLLEAGIEPVQGAYLGLSGDIPRVSSDTVRDLARAACADDADAVFLACTNLPTVDVLAELEEELGVPVLSANLVSIWAALRGLRTPTGGRPERLFQFPAAA